MGDRPPKHVPGRPPPQHIVHLSDHKLRDARALYRETYGREVNDPATEEDLHQILREHDFDKRGDKVAVPAKLLLAFILRPRGQGKGRKRPPKERWGKRWNDLVVRNASKGWAERVAAGQPSKRAKRDAAVEAHGKIHYHDLSVSTIEVLMRLNKRKSD